MKKTLLWLDDERNPNSEKWYKYLRQYFDIEIFDIIWVKSYSEFIQFVENNILPYIVCFDNDLGDVVTNFEGYDCAKYLSNFCIENKKQLPNFIVQSANPVAKQNIETYLNNHNKYFDF
jgi:hypothetical protein